MDLFTFTTNMYYTFIYLFTYLLIYFYKARAQIVAFKKAFYFKMKKIPARNGCWSASFREKGRHHLRSPLAAECDLRQKYQGMGLWSKLRIWCSENGEIKELNV